MSKLSDLLSNPRNPLWWTPQSPYFLTVMKRKKTPIKRVTFHVLPWFRIVKGFRETGWQVTRSDAPHSEFTFAVRVRRKWLFKKSDAIEFAVSEARYIVQHGGASQVVIHKRNSAIQKVRTYGNFKQGEQK